MFFNKRLTDNRNRKPHKFINTIMYRLVLVLFFLMPLALSAQFEAGLMVGVSNYGGDLAPKSVRTSLGQTHAAFGGFLRYNILDHLTARLNVYYGRVSADDAKAETQARLRRNLSFRSPVVEAGLTFEYNILGYNAYNYARPFSPYIYAGIGGFYFNPSAFYNDEWVKLQPLGTEGQGITGFSERVYKRISLAIPMGLGVKYTINDQWNIGLEIGARKTFTDYLDDVSATYVAHDDLLAGNGELAVALANRTGEYLGTEPVQVPAGTIRGNAEGSDWYFIGGLTISFNFSDNGLVGSRRRGRRGNGCYKL